MISVQGSDPVCIILEPRISGNMADMVVKKLGFKNHFREEDRGFSGGFWVLWNDHQVCVNVIKSNY